MNTENNIIKKPLLVFLHGWAFDKTVWDGFSEQFEDAFRIYTPNLYDHFPSIVDELAMQIQDRAEGAEVYLIGWSLGYLIAAQLSAQIKIRKIVGLAAVPFFCSEHGISFDTIALLEDGLAEKRARTLRKFYQWVYYPERSSSVVDEKFTFEELRDTLIMLSNISTLKMDLPETLFLLGEKDAVLPVAAASDFSDIESHVYPERGHLFFREQPAEVVRDVKMFLLRDCAI